ncbi:hypothetical protein QBC32DRAFT_351427 [Pseudoneurospora amorphoporcata]|uniref:Uncharacterized protein n=1 Tax=Pseudoneurospora amorphoporcata TaxID=241081 RepID=A0AAN6NP17_9PEZI|nr:hypothetical protein QBC32DRAFT_351427 [Pseudoneurospora amorphoporcata]
MSRVGILVQVALLPLTSGLNATNDLALLPFSPTNSENPSANSIAHTNQRAKSFTDTEWIVPREYPTSLFNVIYG